jgi:hypothetical protein
MSSAAVPLDLNDPAFAAAMADTLHPYYQAGTHGSKEVSA